MKPKSGRVIYGSRAFHQDATEAMRGDIVRALIETITNSDDAYGANQGKIRVEIEHRRGGPWKVITRDRARGMSTSRMETAIAQLGGQTSGFESGAEVRGNLGRGSKDLAAFGPVDFESICDGEYAHMHLDSDGNYNLDSPTKATDGHRSSLGIPRANGTVVTIHAQESIRCPLHQKLLGNLARHYQLRDIFSDPRREVTLVDINRDALDQLRYQYPDLERVLRVDLDIPGYPEAKGTLLVYRNAERFDDPPSDPSRPAGILVKGRRAIYENTLFRYESSPYAGWFSGRLECPYIDQLAAEYDRRLVNHEKQPDSNPMPIITRRRDGLQKAHPFYKALSAVAEEHLAPLIAEEERKARENISTESTRLRKKLDGLGRDLSKLLDEDLKEIDEEGLLGAPGDSGNIVPIRLIPEEPVLYLGEDKTLTVVVLSSLNSTTCTVQVDPGGIVELLDGRNIELSPHKKRPELLAGQIRVRPILEDQTMLTVECMNNSAVCIIEVRKERDIIEVEPKAVDKFKFERDAYRIAWTHRKELKLFATLEEIAAQGTTATVSSSDAGVVVRRQTVAFVLDEELEQYEATVVVEARTLSAHSTVTARLGRLQAKCKVDVSKEEAGPSLTIRIVDEEAGNYRSIVDYENGQTVIKIMGRHPTMRRYRGPAPLYQGDDLITTQLLVAEIVSDQAARMILEKKFPSTGTSEQLDAARFYVEHYRYMSKYLQRCHKSLVSDASLEQLKAREIVDADASARQPELIDQGEIDFNDGGNRMEESASKSTSVAAPQEKT